ncbi:hypothetical protein [Patulibacter minatonensis]|uniref:hypothetical protein n=1 Tax=Patulibacter minatonensis TaxID=298163 RepID=UPI00047BDF7F|nr:hypothetical protein [Patulibacter minatonensis]
MKFQTTPAFDRDYKRLSKQHQAKFRKLVPRFNAAAERAAAGETAPWPNGMRVKPVKGAEGVWEVTWSMDDPDGRATWEWVTIGDTQGIRWRRIGDHDVFASP